MARVRGLVNPGRDDARLPPAPDTSAVAAFHRSLPGYSPTPLHEIPALAAEAGVARVVVKDESWRLGLPAFKILGASWASYRVLLDHLGETDRPPEAVAARVGGSGLVLATATDGNHGRAVAHMARRFGLGARVFVPAGTAAERIAAIRAEGASCEVVAGTYEDAVAVAAAQSDALVVSDTSWEGYEQVPQWIVAGYATLFDEIEALGVRPDVVLVPIGVGALAAAAAQWFRSRALPTRLVGVEPEGADCLLASAARGEPTLMPGPHRSIMAGLNCGAPSPRAWPWVWRGFDGFLAVDDDTARLGMRVLAGEGIVSGESGAAGTGALSAVARGAGDRSAIEALGLRQADTVLLLSTEGATDPTAYRAVVGRHPDAVAARRAPAPGDR